MTPLLEDALTELAVALTRCLDRWCPPLFLTEDEAANRLGVSRIVLRRLINAGDLRTFQIVSGKQPQHVRIDGEELDRYIAARRGR